MTTIPTLTATQRAAGKNNGPWIALGLFDHEVAEQADTTMGFAVNPRAYSLVEVRPARDDGDDVVAVERGNPDFKPDFWSVYLRDSEGRATCVADLPNDIAADRLAEAIMATYPGLSGVSGIHSPIRASDEAEAAQCLWEAVLDAAAATGSPNLPEWVQHARDALDSMGHGEVRSWMRSLARPCLVAWNRAEHLHGYDGDCFDWVYCPEWLAHLDWSMASGGVTPSYDPAWLPAKVRAAVPEAIGVKVEPAAADTTALPLRTFVIQIIRDGDVWSHEGDYHTEDGAKAAALVEVNRDWSTRFADWDEMAGYVDATDIDAHPEVMAPRMPAATVDAYRRLADGLSDMVEEGRLNEADIPDDYRWLVEQLATIAGLDPIRTKTVIGFGPTPPAMTTL